MSAALLWARTNLRSRWRSAALVVLIAGLCGALSMAAIAGARRTTTSFERFVRATKDLNVYVAVPDKATADVALSVMQRVVGPRVAGEVVFLAAKPTTMGKNEEFNLGTIGDLTEIKNRTVSIPKIVAGRLPSGQRDVALNDLAAKRLGVGPGDHLAMVGYSPAAFAGCSSDPSNCATDLNLGDVSVVGILRFPSDISPEVSDSMSIGLSPALTRSWIPSVANQGWIAGAYIDSATLRDRVGTALTDAIGPDRISGASADVFLETNAEGDPERVNGALDVEHNGLLLLGALAAVAGLVAVPQAIARHRAASIVEDSSLLALGWTARDQRRAGAMWSALLGVAAALVAGIGAIAISPLFPIGLARLAEPSPGVHSDLPVLASGAISILIVVVVAGAVVRAGRRRAPAASQGRVASLFSALRPVPATAGRFLLEEGRMSVVVRTTLAASVFGVAMMACAATVIRSQDYMTARPALYGAPWDLQGPVVGDAPDADALTALDADPGVAATAILTGGRIGVDGEDIGATSIEALKGSIEPTILSGRPVRNDGEIVIGPAVMARDHLSIGDSVAVKSSSAAGKLTIVGTGVPVSVGSFGSDSGAIVSTTDFRRYGTPSTIDNEGGVEVAVRLAPGADVSVVRNEMVNITGGFERVINESFRPARIANF
ncbi:MAG TPA: hypothetical protein VGC84_11775, partial [Ilumatobacteraceae bacterium]